MTTGTVFDIGYQGYAGVREGRNRSQLAVFKDGVRTALGLGRPARTKVMPWFFIVVLGAIGLIMALVAGTINRLAGPEAAQRLPSHLDYYGIASIIMFVFAAVVAPELLCPDRRDGTINLYLVRPMTGTDYILARIAAFLVVMTAAAWLPQFILFAGLCMSDPQPFEYLRFHWLNMPKFMGAGMAMAAYATSLALLVASFTTRRAYASVFLVGLFVISMPFTIGMAQEMKGALGEWISMFNLSNIPVHVNDAIFGGVSAITKDAPARKLGAAVLVSWYFLWTLGGSGLLWWRYRRLQP